MSTRKEQKIKWLLNHHLPGTVSLASWMEDSGISYDLQKRYRKSGWLESIGTGAFIRPGDTIAWQGALYTLQTQANLKVHAGGLTALSLHGLTHYFRLGAEILYLFSSQGSTLPRWFKNYDWRLSVQHIKTTMLPEEIGLVDYEKDSFTIKVATPERALLECLYLTPDKMDIIECYQLMEGLVNLRPKLIQELLEKCTSVKVKRLFLYMADKANHQWCQFLDLSMVNLGTGDRSITKGGKYISSYKITVPKNLTDL